MWDCRAFAVEGGPERGDGGPRRVGQNGRRRLADEEAELQRVTRNVRDGFMRRRSVQARCGALRREGLEKGPSPIRS